MYISRDTVFQASDKGKSNHAEMFHYSDRLNPQRTLILQAILPGCNERASWPLEIITGGKLYMLRADIFTL